MYCINLLFIGQWKQWEMTEIGEILCFFWMDQITPENNSQLFVISAIDASRGLSCWIYFMFHLFPSFNKKKEGKRC